jgi:hypothetical protein
MVTPSYNRDSVLNKTTTTHTEVTKTRKLSPGLAATGVVAAPLWLLKWYALGLPQPIGDGPYYLDMASGAEGRPPWSFHILAPRLAGLISPQNPAHGFALIAAVSFVLTAMTMFLILRKVYEFDLVEQVLGVALFMTTCTGAFMFRFYFLTDSLAYLLLALACAAGLYRKDALLAVVTWIAVFNRETAFFIFPVWILLNVGTGSGLSLMKRFVLVLTPAAVAYIILHHTPLVFGHMPQHLNYLAPQNAMMVWRSNLSWLGTNNVYYGLGIWVFLAYGPAWFLSGWGFYQCVTRLGWQASRPFVALWGLILPVVATLLVVDWVRGFQPLFPAVVASAVFGFRALTKGSTDFARWLLAAATIFAAVGTAEAWRLPPMRQPVFVSMAIWVCVLLFVLIRTSSHESQHRTWANLDRTTHL